MLREVVLHFCASSASSRPSHSCSSDSPAQRKAMIPIQIGGRMQSNRGCASNGCNRLDRRWGRWERAEGALMISSVPTASMRFDRMRSRAIQSALSPSLRRWANDTIKSKFLHSTYRSFVSYSQQSLRTQWRSAREESHLRCAWLCTFVTSFHRMCESVYERSLLFFRRRRPPPSPDGFTRSLLV